MNIIKNKKIHKARFSNKNGSNSEQILIEKNNWLPRPKGKDLKLLLKLLSKSGAKIKPSSFDAIYYPKKRKINFNDESSLQAILEELIFIEIKSANQDRVKDDFTGYFFAITENEINAAKKLGDRHKVVLYNRKTEKLHLTSVSELIARAKSKSWQLSIQL